MRKLLFTLALLGSIALIPATAAARSDELVQAYESPRRAECEAEMAKDVRWKAELRNQLRPDIHQEDANLMLTNKKHVVMAYTALWILAVVFLVLLWLRQQRLIATISRLERDVKKAAAT